MAAYQIEVPVRFGDVDHAGIVYYPRFFFYFHECFEDFFASRGVPYATVLGERDVGFPTVHAEADYKAPLRFGDVIVMSLSVSRVGDKSATFVYECVRKRDGVLACVGTITCATVRMSDFTATPVPEWLREMFAEIARPDAR